MPSATKAHERVFPLGSCNGFVLCGIPYRGWMRYRLLSALRTGFPLPHSGQATKATGRLHCYICNFLRVAQATLLCKSRKALIHAPFRDFLRIAMGGGCCNLQRLWKGAGFCGKGASGCMESGRNWLATLRFFGAMELKEALQTGVQPDSAGPGSPNPGFQGREITPRSVNPFTKNCMASATSNSPMILTRMRIPVSPSTVFTLPAPASTR